MRKVKYLHYAVIPKIVFMNGLPQRIFLLDMPKNQTQTLFLRNRLTRTPSWQQNEFLQENEEILAGKNQRVISFIFSYHILQEMDGIASVPKTEKPNLPPRSNISSGVIFADDQTTVRPTPNSIPNQQQALRQIRQEVRESNRQRVLLNRVPMNNNIGEVDHSFPLICLVFESPRVPKTLSPMPQLDLLSQGMKLQGR